MKRALFCVWMVLALGWCAAWAETDWPPMTAEVTEDERFSIVEEGETRLLRYERKQGDTWATIWENDAILPDGELGWIYIDSSPGGGEWVTKWFIRKVGPQVSVYASWRREAEYEDFAVGWKNSKAEHGMLSSMKTDRWSCVRGCLRIKCSSVFRAISRRAFAKKRRTATRRRLIRR